VTDDGPDGLKSRLTDLMAASRSRVSGLTDDCRRTEERADEIGAKLRERWQRRIEMLRIRANTEAGGKNVL
jgi:hypothetical protein